MKKTIVDGLIGLAVGGIAAFPSHALDRRMELVEIYLRLDAQNIACRWMNRAEFTAENASFRQAMEPAVKENQKTFKIILKKTASEINKWKGATTAQCKAHAGKFRKAYEAFRSYAAEYEEAFEGEG